MELKKGVVVFCVLRFVFVFGGGGEEGEWKAC